ncbi:hypothetical protein EDEG_02239 [Edhazardia aedis USNM 41457]|uniref:AB hydrolase-1 domain-containing protein n=1 Tax=Edhazardia aedis (strain USNM 41457) TaxID=1003232 RepID=J9D7B5_EDHAE|nr:hypothetical protein EDEG_02239 [Edhazardia aedis USNM 41457]|eukprot:EJW03419.1 hypothetical protein EDEG_02239 [Edhazardia aedis USNM 41457]
MSQSLLGTIILKIIKILFLKNYHSKDKNIDTFTYHGTVLDNGFLLTKDNVKIGFYIMKPKNMIIETDINLPNNVLNNNEAKHEVFLFLHGNSDNRKQSLGYIPISTFRENNWIVMIPDYRDFGDSSGNFQIDKVSNDIDACVTYLFKTYKQKVNIIGFSLGSAIALRYIKYLVMNNPSNSDGTLNDERINKIVLFGTFTNTIDVLNRFCPWRVVNYIFPFIKNMLIADFYYDNVECTKYIHSDNLLLIHGQNDEFVSDEEAKKFNDHGQKILVKIKDGSHHSILKNEFALNIMRDFVRDIYPQRQGKFENDNIIIS